MCVFVEALANLSDIGIRSHVCLLGSVGGFLRRCGGDNICVRTWKRSRIHPE